MCPTIVYLWYFHSRQTIATRRITDCSIHISTRTCGTMMATYIEIEILVIIETMSASMQVCSEEATNRFHRSQFNLVQLEWEETSHSCSQLFRNDKCRSHTNSVHEPWIIFIRYLTHCYVSTYILNCDECHYNLSHSVNHLKL